MFAIFDEFSFILEIFFKTFYILFFIKKDKITNDNPIQQRDFPKLFSNLQIHRNESNK